VQADVLVHARGLDEERGAADDVAVRHTARLRLAHAALRHPEAQRAPLLVVDRLEEVDHAAFVRAHEAVVAGGDEEERPSGVELAGVARQDRLAEPPRLLVVVVRGDACDGDPEVSDPPS
jgi:hypothetical protein